MYQIVNYTYSMDFGSDTMKIKSYDFSFIGKRIQQALTSAASDGKTIRSFR